MGNPFDYHRAFARNIGWLTEAEQHELRTRRVAIAGLGGVGGSHLLTLARLGIGAFHISDFDRFELANFNRQAGATLSALDRPKVDVLAEAALEINPDLDLRRFPEGVDAGNVDTFLRGVDVYVDGLDFFAVEARRRVFAACAERDIPAVTVAPLGMGAALLNFMPGRMTFEAYFRLEGEPEQEQLLRFLVGLSPAMLQRGYLVDRSAVDLARHRGPSTPMACELCAGIAASEVAKILLRRGPVIAAPQGLHFDAYRNRYTRTWRPGGNRNPIQRLAIRIARRQLQRMTAEAPPAQTDGVTRRSTLERILDKARWAPSGDNSQPWRFAIESDTHVVVLGHDTRSHCVYDLRGHASQLSHGALLETIAIAASEHGLKAGIRRRDGDDAHPIYDVYLTEEGEVRPDPLAAHIGSRTVQRRPLSRRALRARERQGLEQALPPGFEMHWLDGPGDRARMAALLFRNGGLRLALPEAYPVHRDIIEWNARESTDRIPDQAVGLDPMTSRLTRWAMASWERVAFLNRYLAGSIVPRIELDLLPGLACAAHFVILGPRAATEIDDFVEAGRVVQRFWLTATRLGLLLQPQMTPLIFHQYVRDGVEFTQVPRLRQEARRISARLGALVSAERLDRAVFMGRIGHGRRPRARSTRRALDELLIDPETAREAPPVNAAQAR